jgi:hypothetical protein
MPFHADKLCSFLRLWQMPTISLNYDPPAEHFRVSQLTSRIVVSSLQGRTLHHAKKLIDEALP